MPNSHRLSKAKGRVAGLSRSRTENDPEFLAARAELRAIWIEEQVTKAFAAWPPLTAEHRARLVAVCSTAPVPEDQA